MNDKSTAIYLNICGHIIGKNGNGVKNIIEASGVIKIIFDARKAEIPQVEGMVTIVCVRTEEKIHKALALMKDKISYHLDVHMLSKKKSPPKQGLISKPPNL